MWLAELHALFRRTMVRVLLAVLFVIPVLMAVAVRISGGPSPGNGPGFFDQVASNGLFVALAGLVVTVPFFLPLAVAVVSGDTIAGEASLGTLRYLLTRPTGRVRLLAAKAMTVVAFSLAAGLAVIAGGLAAGAALFHVGPLLSLSGTTISVGGGLWRILLAAVVVSASLLGLAAIGIFLSTLFSSAIPATAVTVGLVIVAFIAESIPELSFAHPWLFSHNWLAFSDLLLSPIAWHRIGRDLLLQAGYIVVFGTAAWARFASRDILS